MCLLYVLISLKLFDCFLKGIISIFNTVFVLYLIPATVI